MENPASQTITGILSLVPNPCTTEPCVPGMAYAVVVKTITSNRIPYFLTQNGSLLMQDHVWEAGTPELQLTVKAKGVVRQEREVSGNTFLTLEFIALSTVG